MNDGAPHALLAHQDWRLCVDFGTAASKAAIAAQTDWAGDAARRVRALPLGAASGHSDPLLVPSAVFVDNRRLFFGPAALRRAAVAGLDREPLQSFKMLLGARDLNAVLSSRLKRSIDPDLQLRNQDVLSLYVAFLSALIEKTFTADPHLAPLKGQMKWRYSRPDWRGRDAQSNAQQTLSVFERGLLLGRTHQSAFLSPDGLAIDDILPVLEALAPQEHIVEGSVLEAHAAAAAHIGAAKLISTFVLVLDIGAGTTDFAGFEIAYGTDGRLQMLEIPGARRSVPRAGDEIDTIVMNAVLRKARMQKDHPGQRVLWRSLARNIRELKTQAFAADSAEFHFEARKIVLQRKELLADSMLKSFSETMQLHLEATLRAVAAAAKAAKVKEVSLILAGGGARLPFMQDMVQRTQASWRKDARVVLEPLVPLWARQPDFADMAARFSQLEIAIGGASPLLPMVHAAPD